MGIGWQDRVTGALLGAALGDALGRPFEGNPVPDRAEVREWADAADPLSYTDDTAMLIVVAEILAQCGFDRFDDDALLEAFAVACESEPWRGYGAGPPRIFRAHRDGVPWRETVTALFGGQGSFGNGGAMRVAPAALVARDLCRAVELARRSAAVTHAHPLGQDGAAVQAAAVFQALHSGDGPLDRAAFMTALDDAATTKEFASALELVETLPSSPQPHYITALLGNGIEALHSVPAAIAAFLAYPDDPPGAILLAVCCGGDADTIAAMTGAIVGARCGEALLPLAWLRRLEDRERMRRLGEALARARR